jgi:hypothetical protein
MRRGHAATIRDAIFWARLVGDGTGRATSADVNNRLWRRTYTRTLLRTLTNTRG